MFSGEKDRKACRRYEARLEDYLDANLPSATVRQVESHLVGCRHCRQAVEAARSSRALFEPARKPVAVPGRGFARRVMAAIHTEEERRRSGSDLWKPLESLAWRLSWSTMLVLAVLLLYIVGFQWSRNPRPATAQQVEIQDIFPESAPHPASQDEVLLTLAAANTGDTHGK